jgi:hypothetical protein
MNVIRKPLILGCLGCLWVAGVAAETLYSQFETFLAWWPGTYDNSTQIADSSANSAARLIISRIDLPAFGDHVVYAEWQVLGDKVPDDPTTIIRQRFYSFEIDPERQALRLNLHIFPTASDFSACAVSMKSHRVLRM